MCYVIKALSLCIAVHSHTEIETHLPDSSPCIIITSKRIKQGHNYRDCRKSTGIYRYALECVHVLENAETHQHHTVGTSQSVCTFMVYPYTYN